MRQKRCSKCQKWRLVRFFSKKSGRKDGLTSHCKACYRRYYRKNQDRIRAKSENARVARQNENLKNICRYLEKHPCVDCGERDIVVLEFDHVRGHKLFNIAHKASLTTWDKVKVEIDKCDIRCANCHRKKTAEFYKHYKYLWRIGKVSMSDRYLFRPTPTTKWLESGFATRDHAVAWAVKFSKQISSILVYDTHDSPHRLVGKAEKGFWRPPIAKCKLCDGRGWLKPSGNHCGDCESMGAILEPLPWRP